MRVLHIGNVANNGYLNAKFQRRDGIEADAICDERHILSLPEWEDADLHGTFDPYPDLAELRRAGRWERPPWVLEEDDPAARSRFRGHLFLSGIANAYAVPAVRPRLLRRVRADYAPLEAELGPLRPLDISRGLLALERFSLLWPNLARRLSRYDLAQLYATHSILAYLADPDRPYVAFEHGTLRDIPFEDSWRGRLLALSYRQAAKVVITNADVLSSARRLGLDNYVFIPHPVDETKYTPGESAFRAGLGLGDEHLLLSPSSQTWHIKGNDALLRGFAEHVRRGHDAVLVLTDWGPDVERSRALAGELGVAERLRWLPPLPKLRLIEAYRAADVVLDQFVLGTFGAIAPEAMACCCPVVMAIDPGLHEWCFKELPPVVPASEAGEIAVSLGRLADPAERARVGTASRSWVEREHGWRLVLDRHRAIYDEVLAAAAAE
jgi:glycosyltransferase involved in cell wall biosynthesis